MRRFFTAAGTIPPMSTPVLEYHSPNTQSSKPLISRLEKCVLIALGVVLPLICFAIASHQYLLTPEWQSGEWNRYILFIPDGRAGFPFYPLLIYCMVALCVFVARPVSSHSLAVRLGLYTGIILALQYTLIQASAFQWYGMAGAAIGLASNFLVLGILKVFELIPRRIMIYIAVGLAGIITLLILASVIGGRLPLAPVNSLVGLPLGAGIASLALAPAWCTGVYTRATLLALRSNQNSDQKSPALATFIAWIPWLGGYASAWKLSITNAIALYAALPPSAPGCYIATAAAAGHRRFVGSTLTRAGDGAIYPANQQLRRLKCVEIAIAVVCPNVHRLIRRIYDYLGPPLARRIAPHPLVADIAYAILKPVEWASFGLLIAIAPGVRVTISNLYPTRSRDKAAKTSGKT